jgi:hypothetical protein
MGILTQRVLPQQVLCSQKRTLKDLERGLQVTTVHTDRRGAIFDISLIDIFHQCVVVALAVRDEVSHGTGQQALRCGNGYDRCY